MIPCNVFKTSFLRVDVLSIRVGIITVVEPPCRSEHGGTVNVVVTVVILVACCKFHVVAPLIKAIPYNHNG